MNENKEYEVCATIMCEKRKAMSVLRKIPVENLEQVVSMWLDLSGELIDKHKKEQREIQEKQEAAQRFMEENNITPEQATAIFGSILGLDTTGTKRPRAYHKVKYSMQNPAGGKPITWTGKGRRPAAFQNLTDEELQKYAI
ncbi:MAG TPA: hypothetical protein DDY48_11710 [Erwinia persicina]|jgi:DNA-binding protein H-NS|nr:hypothetical protein [Erwinia persicina]HBI07768.1 hypothetical protein [Erwinia persicina]